MRQRRSAADALATEPTTLALEAACPGPLPVTAETLNKGPEFGGYSLASRTYVPTSSTAGQLWTEHPRSL